MKIIGHRGARGLSPENTIASLQKALEHHVDMIEFDVRVTRDGIVILHHDSFLTDPDGEKRPIADYTFAELKDHKKDLATFEEVLKSFADTVTLYIEVKPNVALEPVIKIIKKFIITGNPPERLLLGSKSQKTLLELHKALPAVPTIVIEPWSGVRAHYRARQVGTKQISMNQKWLWWGFIRGFKNSGWRLYAYTLNDPKKAKRWAGYGLYGVVTDYPDQFESFKR
jgi:glycerophosphoryl diester phosphodiesterase